MLRISHFS